MTRRYPGAFADETEPFPVSACVQLRGAVPTGHKPAEVGQVIATQSDTSAGAVAVHVSVTVLDPDEGPKRGRVAFAFGVRPATLGVITVVEVVPPDRKNKATTRPAPRTVNPPPSMTSPVRTNVGRRHPPIVLRDLRADSWSQ